MVRMKLACVRSSNARCAGEQTHSWHPYSMMDMTQASYTSRFFDSGTSRLEKMEGLSRLNA